MRLPCGIFKKKNAFFAEKSFIMPLLGTLAFYNKSHKVTKLSNREAFMESAITVLIFLAVISLSIYLTYYSADTSSSNKFNDILTFCLPFISTLVIGIAVINKFIYLPIVITVALIAGVLSLLVSWSAEKKAKEAKQKKNRLFIMNIYMFPRSMRSAV